MIQMVLLLRGALFLGFRAAGWRGAFDSATLRRRADDFTSSVKKNPSYSLPHDAQTLLLSGRVSPQIGHFMTCSSLPVGTVALIL